MGAWQTFCIICKVWQSTVARQVVKTNNMVRGGWRAMKIMQVMRNAFLDIHQGGERLRSAPPKINTQQYNYQPSGWL
jgi:hypothetical protein